MNAIAIAMQAMNRGRKLCIAVIDITRIMINFLVAWDLKQIDYKCIILHCIALTTLLFDSSILFQTSTIINLT